MYITLQELYVTSSSRTYFWPGRKCWASRRVCYNYIQAWYYIKDVLLATEEVVLGIEAGVLPGFMGKMQKSTSSGIHVNDTGQMVKPKANSDK